MVFPLGFSLLTIYLDASTASHVEELPGSLTAKRTLIIYTF